MARLEYFLKRLLLVIPTFIGITFIVTLLCQFVPGGPVEQYVMQMQGAQTGEAGRGATTAAGISPEQRKALEEHFHFDKPVIVQYWIWLVDDHLGMSRESYKFPNKTTWQLIKERFPVSLIFGVTGFFLSYLICIPLGIGKALRNGLPFDVGTSLIVFVGYAIPPFAFGMILKMLLAGTVEGWPSIFPHAGFVSDNFEDLAFWGKAKDLFAHMFLPVLCYMIGHFAFLTLLMKNSLLEEISKDYVRTARAKGCSRRRTVWFHALRNSLIPIATGFGGILSIMFAGSVLIEQVFEIPGMGRLSLEAIVTRDYAVFMGILSITAFLGILGNILSDLCYVLIDPRIDFSK